MSIFSGLESLGLGGLENVDIFGSGEKKPKEEKKTVEKEQVREEDMLLHKTLECPVCNMEIDHMSVRANKIRAVGHDLDLRQRYKEFDLIKYDVVVCNHCGYANLTKFHGPMAKPYRQMLREKIMPNYKPMKMGKDKLTYEDAVLRYKLALMNAVVRQGKNSEKAYIALKLSWIYRGMRETLSEEEREKAKELLALEREHQMIALEGFKKAQATETPPYAGLNDETLDYLLAVLSMEAGDYDFSRRILSEILTSTKSTKVQKQQADLVMEEVKRRMKADGEK